MRFDPWTFGLQAINFLVLAWLLNRFLYRPVLGIIAARKAAADRLIQDVEAEKASAEAVRRKLDQQNAAAAGEREAELSRAREAAEAERTAILDKARQEAEEAQAAARGVLERERAEATRDLGRDAVRLAVSIARRLLDERSAAAVQAGMVERLCADLREMTHDDRRRIAGSLGPPAAGAKVVTALPLDESGRAGLSVRLSEALGAPATPEFEVDPALIAGVELHFPFAILRRSWSDDLKRIQAELTHDDAETVA